MCMYVLYWVLFSFPSWRVSQWYGICLFTRREHKHTPFPPYIPWSGSAVMHAVLLHCARDLTCTIGALQYSSGQSGVQALWGKVPTPQPLSDQACSAHQCLCQNHIPENDVFSLTSQTSTSTPSHTPSVCRSHHSDSWRKSSCRRRRHIMRSRRRRYVLDKNPMTNAHSISASFSFLQYNISLSAYVTWSLIENRDSATVQS